MILGNGLVANNLLAFQDDKSVLIFASGVSNSGEKNQHAYDKEEQLLMAVKDTPSKLVYFSTCSIFDPDAATSAYTIHKKKMEALIAKTFPNYLILRLPLLIANTPNQNTFYNYIANRVLNQERLEVYKNAWRYIFDAEDLSQFVPLLIKENGKGGKVLNLVYQNAARVPDLVSLFEKILNKQAKKEVIERGTFYDFDTEEFASLLKRNHINFDKDAYNYATLKKYLSRLT